MVKNILSIFILFLMLSSVSFAKGYDSKIKEEFGKDLTHAPFTLRFAFSKRYHIDWKQSTFAERRTFLTNYEIGVEQDARHARDQARADAAYRRDRANQSRAAARAHRDKEKAEAAAARAEAKETSDRNKSFNKTVTDQQKELQQMEHSLSQGN